MTKDSIPYIIRRLSDLAEFLDNPNLTPTAEARNSLYVLQPLPRNIERIRTRLWTAVRTGT